MKLTPIVAIVGIVILEAIALANGIDGVLMSGAIAVIGGLAGYQAKTLRDRIKGGKH